MIAYYLNPKTNLYNYTTLQIPIVSPNGNCIVNKAMINFLEDQKHSCSNKFTNEFNTCLNFNGKRIFNKAQLTIIAGISQEDKLIKYVPLKEKFKKIQSRFYTYDYDWANATSASKFERLPITGLEPNCLCSNIITKVEYNFYVYKTEIKEYEVVYYLEDVEALCGKQMDIDLNFEINFKNHNKVRGFFLIIFLFF